MRTFLLAVLTLLCVVGCSPDSPNATTAIIEPVQETPDVMKVSFADEDWFFSSNEIGDSDLYRRGMDHFVFTRPGSDLRLLVVLLPDSESLNGLSEGVYESLMQVQKLEDGKRWVGHGPFLYHELDGEFSSGTRRDGKLDGTDRAYWANGNLHMETPYVFGKRNGVGNGYYEDGTRQWTATYVNDVEVSGESFSRE